MFFVPLLAYSLCGYYAFGSRVEQFHTVSKAMETILIMAFGTFQDDVLARYRTFHNNIFICICICTLTLLGLYSFNDVTSTNIRYDDSKFEGSTNFYYISFFDLNL